MYVKLTFREFIEAYLSSEQPILQKNDMPAVVGKQLLELYSYEFTVHNTDSGNSVVAGHLDDSEADLEDYVDFLLDMQRAINKKNKTRK